MKVLCLWLIWATGAWSVPVFHQFEKRYDTNTSTSASGKNGAVATEVAECSQIGIDMYVRFGSKGKAQKTSVSKRTVQLPTP